MPQTTYRLAINQQIHHRIKMLAIRRRANRLPLASISEIVGEALSSWLVDGQPKPTQLQPSEGNGIQTTFRLRDSQITQLYADAIVKRLEDEPMRRAGARLDRAESDGILQAWLDTNSEEMEPLRVPE